MIDTKPMRQQRAKLINDAQAIGKKAMDEKRSLTAAERDQVDKMLADEKVLKADIDRFETMNSQEADLSLSRSGLTLEDQELGGGNDKGKAAVEAAAKKALEAYRSYLTTGAELEGLRAITVADTSGYTVPQLAITQYNDALANFTDIRQAPVQIIGPTSTGGDLPIPTFDDTSSDADEQVEGDDVGDADDFSVGQIVLKSYMVTTGVLKVSEQYIRDSAIDAVAYVTAKLGERLARRHNKRFTTGTGTAQAKGIVTAASVGKTLAAGHSAAIGTGADSAAIAKDLSGNLNALIASVTRPYRQVSKTGWMMNDNTSLHLKGYVDSTGRGLWQPSLTDGEPDRLLGYPVWPNNDLADIGALAKPILFGNYSYFALRYVGAMAVKRFNERYGEKLMIGFLGYHAIDSNLLDTNAIKSMQCSA